MAKAKGMVVIDVDRCKGCALCVPRCPQSILVLVEGRFNAKGYNPISVTNMDECTGCAVCAIVCPDVVFSVYRQAKQPKVA